MAQTSHHTHDTMYSYGGDKKPIFRCLSVLSTCSYDYWDVRSFNYSLICLFVHLFRCFVCLFLCLLFGMYPFFFFLRWLSVFICVFGFGCGCLVLFIYVFIYLYLHIFVNVMEK